MSISPGFPSNCYSDPYPVAAADEVRSKRQRQGAGADHADVAGGAWRHILLNGHYTFQSDGKMIDLDALVAGLKLE